MNKKQHCYNCGRPLLVGVEYDICNKCALEQAAEEVSPLRSQANAAKIEKRRKPADE